MKIAIISPHTTSFIDEDNIRVNLNELDNVENASCLSVNLVDTMDYIPYDQRDKLLQMAYSKLRIGGEITLSGTDLYAITNNVYNNLVTIEQANASIYGNRLSCDFASEICNKLHKLGCFIKNSKLAGVYYSIKAIRQARKEENDEN